VSYFRLSARRAPPVSSACPRGGLGLISAPGLGAAVATSPPEIVVGIDEAGRGSWLGPLVVAAFAVPADRLEDVPATGAKDSKRLPPGAREAVYGRLERLGACRSVAIPPRTIDRSVARGQLNRLEAQAFARLLRAVAPGVAYVDACDVDAARFGRIVAALAGGATRVIARHHADRDIPLVGAASVVAKVRRDRAIRRLAERLGTEIGSGYPSDARTVEFVRRTVRAGTALPDWMRVSWATTKRVIVPRPAETLDGFRG
jgi:ribonuclease HII